MAPDATHTPMVKRDKNACGQHARLAFGMFIWLIQECTESGIFLVNEISILSSVLNPWCNRHPGHVHQVLLDIMESRRKGFELDDAFDLNCAEASVSVFRLSVCRLTTIDRFVPC